MTHPFQLTHVDTLVFQPALPFDFRHTLWKPSHFATGLERHSVTQSWRSFREGQLFCGLKFVMASEEILEVEVFADGNWHPENRASLEARIIHGYGLHEDPTDFLQMAAAVPAMQEPLNQLTGMRQSCPESLFEIAIISLLLQNTTIARTTQMMDSLLSSYGHTVTFDGVVLNAFFTPQEIAGVGESVYREKHRLGYRAKYIGRFAEYFGAHPMLVTEDSDKEAMMEQLKTIKGVGPYTAAIIAGHAIRDMSALGLDVWNRKLLAQAVLKKTDAEPDEVKAEMSRLFPGYEGLAALYLIEHNYIEEPMVPLV